MSRVYHYPWPASALTGDEMAMLYHFRESHPDRIPITRLIADAVRAAYGSSQTVQLQPTNIRRLNEAKEPHQEESISQNPAA